MLQQDEIIEMARQSGLVFDAKKPEISVYPPALLSFAKLVDAKATAKEREACAKVCEDLDAHRQVATWYSQAIRARGEA